MTLMRNKPFLLLVLISLFLGFYWYEIRPAKIRHDCSWVKVVEEGAPPRPAMTEDELRQKGLLEDCSKWYKSIFEGNEFAAGFRSSCEDENKRKIEEYKTPREAISPKEWWRKAREEEYKFCLHDKGV